MAALAGGCATPPIDRYLLHTASTPVRLEGGRGPLTHAQSRAILEDLKKRSPETGIFETHVAIEEQLAGSPLIVGNKAVLLEDGAATYRSMLAAIGAARHHVHMETYIFEDDEVGNQFAAALIARRKAGVKVRLMYDSVGSNNTSKEFFKQLEAEGIEVVEFNPLTPNLARFNNRDHRKLTLIDGKVAFLGGINISSVYSQSGSGSASRDRPFEERAWRDTQVRIEGPAVAELQRAFLEQWESQKNEKPDDKAFFPTLQPVGKEIVRPLASKPSEGLNASYVALISAIRSAETEVIITNAYFVPHPELRGALEEAARRGVNVRLVLPSRSDHWLVFNAGRAYYEGLLEAGVKIYERKHRLLHAKSACVDGAWCTIGSTNLDWRSLVHNYELDAVVLGPEFAAQMKALFEKDVNLCEEITAERWRNRPIADRLREAAARAWARFL